jgi:hypothetical protein
MFSKVEQHAQAVKDAAATYLHQQSGTPHGDRSEERAREVDGNESHMRENSSSIYSI